MDEPTTFSKFKTFYILESCSERPMVHATDEIFVNPILDIRNELDQGR